MQLFATFQEEMSTESFMNHVDNRTLACFVAGVRLTARQQRRLTNSQLASEIQTLREQLCSGDSLVITGKMISNWGSKKEISVTVIDRVSLKTLLQYCVQNQISPITKDGLHALVEVNKFLNGNSDLPEFIKKRLTVEGDANGE